MVLKYLVQDDYQNFELLEEVLKECYNPEGYCFSDESLTGVDISEICFMNCIFDQCYFSSCDISDTSFINCTFKQCYMEDCDLCNSDFQDSTIEKDKDDKQGLGLWLDKCNLEKTSFVDSNIEGLYLEHCEISEVSGLNSSSGKNNVVISECKVSPLKGMGLVISAIIGSVFSKNVNKNSVVKKAANLVSKNTSFKVAPSTKAHLFCSEKIKIITNRGVNDV